MLIFEDANLLQKALDPSIWPLRVIMREWIYYSNRNKTESAKSNSKESNSVPTTDTPAQMDTQNSS